MTARRQHLTTEALTVAAAHVEWAQMQGMSYSEILQSVDRCGPISSHLDVVIRVAGAWMSLPRDARLGKPGRAPRNAA